MRQHQRHGRCLCRRRGTEDMGRSGRPEPLRLFHAERAWTFLHGQSRAKGPCRRRHLRARGGGDGGRGVRGALRSAGRERLVRHALPDVSGRRPCAGVRQRRPALHGGRLRQALRRQLRPPLVARRAAEGERRVSGRLNAHHLPPTRRHEAGVQSERGACVHRFRLGWLLRVGAQVRHEHRRHLRTGRPRAVRGGRTPEDAVFRGGAHK